MGLEIPIVGGVSLLIGFGIGFYLFKYSKFKDRMTEDGKRKTRIVNDPDLLLEKLNQNEFVDDGEKVSFEIEEKDGVRSVKVNRSEIKVKHGNTPKVQKRKPKASTKKKKLGKKPKKSSK